MHPQGSVVEKPRLAAPQRRKIAKRTSLARDTPQSNQQHLNFQIYRNLTNFLNSNFGISGISGYTQIHSVPNLFLKASEQATVLEVRAADRPGVVYLVCSALARLDVAVRSAHLDTLGPQAVDVFYLQEASAGALSETRAAEAAHAVRAALS